MGGTSATGTIQDDDAPTSITVVAGSSPQSATIHTYFAVPLAVDVRNAAGTLVQGVAVTFTAPANGPSGSFPGGLTVSVVTDASGRATAPPFQANGLVGSYQVAAQASGGGNPATDFNLSNKPTSIHPVPVTAVHQPPPPPGGLPPGVGVAAVATNHRDDSSAPLLPAAGGAPSATGRLVECNDAVAPSTYEVTGKRRFARIRAPLSIALSPLNAPMTQERMPC
jgi:hypothetical protein